MSRYSLIGKTNGLAWATLLIAAIVEQSGPTAGAEDRFRLLDAELLQGNPADIMTLYSITSEPDSYRDFCRSGKQIRKLERSLTRSMSVPLPGTPLDKAVDLRKKEQAEAREWAASYLERLIPRWPLFRDHVLFIPPHEQRRLKMSCSGGPCGYINGQPKPSISIEQSEKTWKEYMRVFTTVKEHADADEMTFTVSLDLSLACRHARPSSDLVTHTER